MIASQSGHRLPPLAVEQNEALAVTPVEELLGLPFLQPDQVTDSLHAYQIAKRGNSLRVMAEAVAGAACARVNTISPGIIITPLAKDELTGPRERYRRMIELSAAGRAGTLTRWAPWRASHGPRRWIHHRQRHLDGRRSDRRLLVRRACSGPEAERRDGESNRTRRVSTSHRARCCFARGGAATTEVPAGETSVRGDLVLVIKGENLGIPSPSTAGGVGLIGNDHLVARLDQPDELEVLAAAGAGPATLEVAVTVELWVRWRREEKVIAQALLEEAPVAGCKRGI